MLKPQKNLIANPFRIIGLLYIILAFSYASPIYTLVSVWLSSPEFGHGLILAGIAGYILWLRRNAIASSPRASNGWGLLLLLLSFCSFLVGVAGDITILQQYSLVLSLAAIPLYLGGLRLFRLFGFPLVLLFFSIPFYPSLEKLLTSGLQLVSTDIGVWFIRAMGMAALQDGNVINMGDFVMLVEEACSGLRYLLPLTGLSLLAAYYFKGNYALKLLIVLSATPVTVIMNSFRIAATGLIIKHLGSEAAQGFLHDFEGLVVFGSACLLQVGLLALISLFLGRGFKISNNFEFESWPQEKQVAPSPETNATTTISCIAICVIAGFGIHAYAFFKEQVIPPRQSFSQFPLIVDERELYPDILDDHFLDILKPTDYFIGDFIDQGRQPINLYMAYYESQDQGSLIHSPKACIPAGGWEIVSLEVFNTEALNMEGFANRAVIEKESQKLLVYFWINQQGKNFADESASYLELVKRSTLHGRTDATLVRVIIPLSDNSANHAKDEENLRSFIKELNPVLPEFLPL